jgi:hypothetical protein
VSARHVGIPEVVHDGVTAFLPKEGDVHPLAHGMERVPCNPMRQPGWAWPHLLLQEDASRSTNMLLQLSPLSMALLNSRKAMQEFAFSDAPT